MFCAERVDAFIGSVEQSLTVNGAFQSPDELMVGVDLGTAYIVVVVLNGQGQPVACELAFSQVLKDGLVVDYIGAVNTVRQLKAKLENRLGVALTKAAIAVPPGTSPGDQRTHVNVVEACEMDVTAIVEEPTAANAVLNIQQGVIVDIGGGTTGLSVLDGGKVIYTADEATGGTHLSLVLSGRYKVSFEEAESLKKDARRQKEVLLAVTPVIQKMCAIVRDNIQRFNVEDVYLVGGTCCLKGVEDIFSKELGIRVYKPANPFLVTPTGIALCCRGED